MKVGILGCGPAGLIAAHTAKQAGHEVRVFSEPRRSYIAGAQYLHEPVPGLHSPGSPDTLITVKKTGTREGYAEKVYGNRNAPVSWSRYDEMEYPAWNMRDAYARLWEAWELRVAPVTLTPDIVAHVASDGVLKAFPSAAGAYCDAWVSTVPLTALCQRNGNEPGPAHDFLSQEVHIVQYEDAYDEDEPSVINYNGDRHPSWYRRSVIFGTEALEWSALGQKPPVEGVVTIRKPLKTNCDCYENTAVPFMLHGRYGSWTKDTLVHHVSRDVGVFLDTLTSQKETA